MAQSWVAVHDYFGARIAVLQHATNIDRAWTTNDAALGSFSLPMGDPQAEFLRSGLLYVIETDTGLPSWVGCKMPRTEIEEDGQQIHMPLRDIGGLLALEHTAADAAYTATAAGAILKEEMRASIHLPLRPGAMADVGPVVDIEPRHQDLLTLARELASDVGYQWWITPTITLGRIWATVQWGQRRGVDLSASVVLEEGRNVKTYPRVSDPDYEHPLSYTAVGQTAGGTAYANRVSGTAHLDAIAGTLRRSSYGQRIAAVSEELSSSSAAERRAVRRLLDVPPIQVQLTVTDVALWPRCAIDNDVTVRLPSYGRGKGIHAKARIVGVQPDEAAGELDLLLEVS